MIKKELEREFDKAMMSIYIRAKREAGYPASYFFRMLQERGGLETALKLLHDNHISKGFTSLLRKGRLDLTVEAVILDEKWRALFTDQERGIARERLEECGYSFNNS